MFNPEQDVSLLVNKENALVKVRYDGPWTGRVEYNKDPQMQGRVKVRIFEIHGYEFEEFNPLGPDFVGPPAPWQTSQKRGTSTRNLPWARPIFPMGGGGGSWDSGAFDVPCVGSNVVILFESGNAEAPLYFGTYHDIMDPFEQDETRGTANLGCRRFGKIHSGWEQRNGGDLPLAKPSMDEWCSPGQGGNQAPLESQDMVDLDPTVRVFFKTPKGHSLIVDDADAREFLELLDRAGQGLRFEAYVTEVDNDGNAQARGLRSAFRGDQVDRSMLVGKEARVALLDVINQGLLLDSREGEERVKLISKSPDPTLDRDPGVTTFEAGLQRQELELSAGHLKTVFRGTNDLGEVVTEIRADSSRGIIYISSEERVVLKSKKGTIDVSESGLVIRGDVSIIGSLDVGGDVKIDGKTTTIGPIVAVGGCEGCSDLIP